MDDDQASNWTDGGGVEVEGAVEVFPGRHVRGKGGMAEEVQGEFGLKEEFSPEEVGEESETLTMMERKRALKVRMVRLTILLQWTSGGTI